MCSKFPYWKKSPQYEITRHFDTGGQFRTFRQMVDKKWETDRRETARRQVGDGDIQEKDGIRERLTGDGRQETGRRQNAG